MPLLAACQGVTSGCRSASSLQCHTLSFAVQETNLLKQFPSFGTYQKNGCNLDLRFYQASELTPATRAWAYELCQQNMRSMYEDVWGWKPVEKQSELKHPDARYLLAHDADGSSVAYVHFRYVGSLS